MNAPFQGNLSRSQLALVVAISLFLTASAFGPLRVPGTGLSLANAALILVAISVVFQRVEPHYFPPALLLLAAAAIDLTFRASLDQLENVSYSVNIAKLALFWIAARVVADIGRPGIYSRIAGVFATALIISEVVAIVFPELRMEVYKTTNDFDFDGFSVFRPTGLFGDPNYFAAPIAVAAVTAWEKNRKGLFSFFLLIALLSGSRSAIIAIVIPVAVATAPVLNQRPRRSIVVSTALILVIVMFFAANSALRGDAGTTDSNKERLNLAIQGLDNVANFSYLTAVYGDQLGRGLSGEPLVIHNTFLQTLTVSFMVGGFFIWVSMVGLRRKSNLAFYAIFIELMFLDVSAYSSLLLLFFLFGVRSERPIFRENR